MFRKPEQGKRQCSNPDHRPMLPEFRTPGEPADASMRKLRRRVDELFPFDHKKWR